MIGEITKGYIDWIMIGVIQNNGIEIIEIIHLIIPILNQNILYSGKISKDQRLQNPLATHIIKKAYICLRRDNQNKDY